MVNTPGPEIFTTSTAATNITNAFSSTTIANAIPKRKRQYSAPLVSHEAVEKLRRSLNISRYIDTAQLAAEDNNNSYVEDKAKRGGRLGALLRRASSTVKAKTKTRRNTHSFVSEASDAPEYRPPTSSAWIKLRQAASFRHWRPEELEGIGHSLTDSCNRSAAPIPGIGNAPPVIPHLGGAAARATAAAQNELFLDRVRNLSVFDEAPGDHDSGVNILATIPKHQPHVQIPDGSVSSRIDFVELLPLELSIQILSHLTCHGLAQAARVSHTWHRISSNHHVWREAFLGDKSRTFATGAPVMSGKGFGIPASQPDIVWKEVYRVRQELDMKWKRGEATPIYLYGHLDSIYCVQFDEYKIITGSRDKTIRIWNLHTYECELIIGPPEIVSIPSIIVGEDNQLLHYASSPSFKTLRHAPKTACFPIHHNASILCLQYDDHILVTGSSDGTCIVYDIKNEFHPIRRLQHHSAAVLDLAFDDKHIVTCSKDATICVWDRDTGEMLKQLRGHSGPVNAVQLRGNTIVSCSGDFKVKLWNIDTGKNIREFSGHTKGLACSQFSDDSRLIASAGNDRTIRIWDANTGECKHSIEAHTNLVRSLHIDSISGRLVSGSYDQDIKVYDMKTGHNLLTFQKYHRSWVLGAKSDYRRIVSTGQYPQILIMDFGENIRGIELLESPERL